MHILNTKFAFNVVAARIGFVLRLRLYQIKSYNETV
jgi:hypothetical protein